MGPQKAPLLTMLTLATGATTLRGRAQGNRGPGVLAGEGARRPSEHVPGAAGTRQCCACWGAPLAGPGRVQRRSRSAMGRGFTPGRGPGPPGTGTLGLGAEGARLVPQASKGRTDGRGHLAANRRGSRGRRRPGSFSPGASVRVCGEDRGPASDDPHARTAQGRRHGPPPPWTPA